MLNTRTMNLNLIRPFVVVGQSKDMKEAAEKLEMDPSNISRSIKKLESIMNTKLFKNSTELTDDGKVLFDLYEKAYNMLYIAEKNLLQKKDLNTGKISIGISSDMEFEILNEKIKKFKETYPDVSFKILNLPTEDLYKKLSQYYVDFVIDEKYNNIYKSSLITTKEILREEYCIAYNKSKYDIDLRTIKQLNELPLIISKKDKKVIEELFDKNETSLNISLEVSSYNSSMDYVESGLGFAVLPKRVIKDSKLSYMDLNMDKAITLSYIKENLSPSVKEFINTFFGEIER